MPTKYNEKEGHYMSTIDKIKAVGAGFFITLKIILILILVAAFGGIIYGLYLLVEAFIANYKIRYSEGLTLSAWITNPGLAAENLAKYGWSFI